MKKRDKLKQTALQSLESYIDSLGDKKAEILSYWLKDYVRFLKKEEEFDPKKLIRYKRGSIVKVHLGYRIGSEEGGLHYGIIIDDNPQNSPVATIIPLTSVKSGYDEKNHRPCNVYLGDEIYMALHDKLEKLTNEIELSTKALLTRLDTIAQEKSPDSITEEEEKALEAERKASTDALTRELYNWKLKLKNVEKTSDEIHRMKRGSIALVNQITTISKIRIYDPLYPGDVLTHIRLSPESMDKIDQQIIALFTKPTR